MRNERKILRFFPQKLRKSFANGNPILKRLSDTFHTNGLVLAKKYNNSKVPVKEYGILFGSGLRSVKNLQNF